ncbi:hypothetical protein C1645_835238 [Glomus cerebriforme]|uniref:Uncharacterized protein n=1 Tax=Glomus cerebriforme TaxID=658196 RepID=A0A397SCT9_9GLOM|nr:hypothetical protein C1645_835238 [Glomus cerebriforme]
MEVTVSTYSDKLFNEYIHPIECKNIGNKTHTDFTNLTQHYNLWKDVKNKDGSVNNVGCFVKGVSDYTQISPAVIFLIGRIVSKFYEDILDANIRSLNEALEELTRYKITIDELKAKLAAADLEQPILTTSSRSTSTENTNGNIERHFQTHQFTPENSSQIKSKPKQKANKSASPPNTPKKVKKERQPHIITGFTVLLKLQPNVHNVMLYNILGKWDAKKITEEINKHLSSLVKATLSKQSFEEHCVFQDMEFMSHHRLAATKMVKDLKDRQHWEEKVCSPSIYWQKFPPRRKIKTLRSPPVPLSKWANTMIIAPTITFTGGINSDIEELLRKKPEDQHKSHFADLERQYKSRISTLEKAMVGKDKEIGKLSSTVSQLKNEKKDIKKLAERKYKDLEDVIFAKDLKIITFNDQIFNFSPSAGSDLTIELSKFI